MTMTNKQIKANILLLLTATLWGFAFVAQKVGADFVPPFTFNAIRFLLGALSLLPVLLLNSKNKNITVKKSMDAYTLKLGIIVGCILFLGAGLQQVGMPYTTASKAGFITGLYIVLVPVFGLFLKHKTGLNTWIGVVLAIIGLYLLSINEDFRMEFGDLLMLCSAFAFTAHILVIDSISQKVDSLQLSFLQFFTCSILNFICSFFLEDMVFTDIINASIPLLYGGVLSVGVAYTLQVVAQKHAKASHAAILMSMEAVFSCIGGMLILSERLSRRGIVGCILLFLAILISSRKTAASKSGGRDLPILARVQASDEIPDSGNEAMSK